jgi:hypothetical protein
MKNEGKWQQKTLRRCKGEIETDRASMTVPRFKVCPTAEASSKISTSNKYKCD